MFIITFFTASIIRQIIGVLLIIVMLAVAFVVRPFAKAHD